MDFSHKPTGSKQINKPFKHGKHKTKSEIRRKAGKVQSATAVAPRPSVKSIQTDSKAVRRLKAKQMAKEKRESILEKKRGLHDHVPRLVAFIPLSSRISMEAVESLLSKQTEIHPSTLASSPSPSLTQKGKHIGGVTVNVPRWKTRMQFYTIKDRNFISIIDIAKVADILVFLVDPEEICDELGHKTISFLKGQGLPTVLGAIQGLAKIDNVKKRKSQKKIVTDAFIEDFTVKSKLVKLDTDVDADQLLRFLSETKINQITWRHFRPYLLADTIDFEPYPSQSENNGDTFGLLKVSGYLRGSHLNPNNIIHITGYGDALVKKIEGGVDPYNFSQHKRSEVSMDVGGQVLSVLAESDPVCQESLVRENAVDPFASEQTWPTPEELEAAEESARKKVPAGVSTYQAAWISDEGEGEDLDEDNEDEDEELDEQVNIDEDMKVLQGNTAKDDSKSVKTVGTDKKSKQGDKRTEKKDTLTMESDGDAADDFDLVDDESVHPYSRKEKRKKEDKEKDEDEEEEEDLLWPDEVDVPEDQPARDRFQKYRGLKSFRTSAWDPKESLPRDYARIFQFQNFRRTYKNLLKNKTNSVVEPYQYISIYLSDISSKQFENHPPHQPLLLSGLFKYENKVSVVNFKVQKHLNYTQSIKSKTPLEFHASFRRWKGQPIFSENTNFQKFKYLKYLRGTCVATLYAPICFPPTTVTMTDAQQEFVGGGSLHSVNPDRIILKKIVLTGHPEKISKNKAIVRNMFYNADDVRWFKPVELWTKYGRTGNIVEPLAMKGKFKAVFDSVMSNQDTVCMSLYKRVYPKWAELTELRKKDKEKDKVKEEDEEEEMTEKKE